MYGGLVIQNSVSLLLNKINPIRDGSDIYKRVLDGVPDESFKTYEKKAVKYFRAAIKFLK